MEIGKIEQLDTNKIMLSKPDLTVSAEFSEEETLDNVLMVIDGLIKAMGYNPSGILDYVEED